jgi:hypothetical protein
MEKKQMQLQVRSQLGPHCCSAQDAEAIVESFALREPTQGERDLCGWCGADNGPIVTGLVGWDARGSERQGWECSWCHAV